MSEEKKAQLPDTLLQLQTLDEIPLLTDSEYAFFERILAGEGPVEAYRATRNVETWSHNRVLRHALELRHSQKIEVCLDAVLGAGGGNGNLSREKAHRELARLQAKAERVGNLAVAHQIMQSRLKVGGLIVDKVQEVSAPDPVAALRKLRAMKGGEELARSLAEQHGIPWAAVEGKAVALRAETVPNDDSDSDI